MSVPETESSMLRFLGQRAEAKDDEKFAKEIQKSDHKSLRNLFFTVLEAGVLQTIAPEWSSSGED